MSAVFRKYRFNPDELFGDDYYAVRNFLIKLDSHNYHFGRWDWMITHGYLDKRGLPEIGIWEDGGEIIALTTYDCGLGKAFLLTSDERRTAGGYRGLREEMLMYAKGALAKRVAGTGEAADASKAGSKTADASGSLCEADCKTDGDSFADVLILDGDLETQDIAARNGFRSTQDKEWDAVYIIGENAGDCDKIHYKLPDGFTITSMAETYDLYKYGQVLWKGFNHEAGGQGPFVFKREDLPKWESEFKRPNCNLDIKIAVAAPNGDFVSYCGMWHDAASKSALVEPVATDPAYRKMGLGRAAVLEGVRRCGKLGATRAYVGSSQQFYYNIGFRPYATSTWWKYH